MTKSIGIIVGVFLMKTLASCCGDCCGGSLEVENRRINDLSLTNRVLNSDGEFDMLDVSTPVDYTNLRIALTLDLIEESEFTAHSVGFSSLLACSPALPYISDQVAEFTITSNQDYYSYEAGESLNEIFRFGDELDADSFRFNDYSYDEIFYFSIIIPPGSSGEYAFTFSLVLSDGREFTLITDPITITS